MGAVMVCILPFALFCPTSFALNPDWQIHQYGHRAWKIEDGFLGGVVNALTQDGKGYLWIGTNKGLFRFDGIRITQWNPPDESRLPRSIVSLLADKDGSLWIGTIDGLVHWAGDRITRYKENPSSAVYSLSQDPDGTVWFNPFQLSAGGDDVLCSVAGAKVNCFGSRYGLPSSTPLLTFVRDPSGTTWLGGAESLISFKDAIAKTYIIDSLKDNRQQLGVAGLAVDADGSLLTGMAKKGSGLGLQRFRSGKWEAVTAPGFDGSQHSISRVLVDRHQVIWIGTFNEGIYRLYQGRVDHLDSGDGLSGNTVLSLYEDGEGSIWLGTNGGLDQLRDLAVRNFSKAAYPKAAEFDNLVSAKDGSLWVGGEGALYTLQSGTNTFTPRGGDLKGKQVTTIFEDHLGRTWIGLDDTMNIFGHEKFTPITMADGRPPGFIISMAEDTENNLWALTTGPPRTLLSVDARTLRASPAIQTIDGSKITSDPTGGLWIGTNTGDILHFSKGTVTPFPFARKSNSRIAQLSVTADGAVLTASDLGFAYLAGNTARVLDASNGLPCSYINNFVFDAKGNFWLYTQCGLVEVSQSDFQRWQKDPSTHIQPRVFDSSDGARTHLPPFEGAARSGDGRLWFNGMDTLQMIDPERMHLNPIPPPVRIEGIRADFRDHSLAETVQLPPLTRDIEIAYTALSLAAPQETIFRYKLVGFDPDWHDVGLRRQAVYMNLRPGTYTFQVLARNNDGVWNLTGDTLSFAIPPKFYQTSWFRVLCLFGLLILFWGFYQLRLREIQRQFNAGLEERVGERTRIARELHDTLLQSLHGLMFQYQAARNMLPRRPQDAMQGMDEAISATEQAIAESRDAIQDLRHEVVAQGDLAQLLKSVGEELAALPAANHDAPIFDIIVEGEPQTLSPIVQHEAYYIGREVIRNAFHHAGAQRIEVEVRYDDNRLRLRLRDDGKGIDPEVLEQSRRPGHWGLPGARERAQRIGSRLDLWSQTGAGTEVELTVPAAIAYTTLRQGSRFNLFRKAGSREQSS
jgi:signal transduction histidine kinase/ligand-binding sensor domain-containing protein